MGAPVAEICGFPTYRPRILRESLAAGGGAVHPHDQPPTIAVATLGTLYPGGSGVPALRLGWGRQGLGLVRAPSKRAVRHSRTTKGTCA